LFLHPLDVAILPCEILGMKLRDYLKSIGVSTDQFGAELGVSGQSVRRWTGGVAFPSFRHLQLIHAATGGNVTFEDFFDPSANLGAGAHANLRREI
jgi:transcriptional regulator with XRE-family HTH domain